MAHLNPQFKVRLEPELKKWLEEKSQGLNLSQSWIVNQAVREMMDREQYKTA